MAASSEELQGNLATYKLQLQQVEAALTIDQDNEQLKKLQTDLQEVIELTLELLKTSKSAGKGSSSGAAASDGSRAGDLALEPGTSAGSSAGGSSGHKKQWCIGDKCLAPWSEDGQYYEAAIEEILEDGTCSVIFAGYSTAEVAQLSSLRPIGSGVGAAGKDTKLNKKDKMAAEREHKKKKALKKLQRIQQLEQEREGDKNRWKDFNSKVFSKTSKGLVKKSIFATTDMAQGKVGVGTCGVSGRPMTDFVPSAKYLKKS